MNAAGGEPVAEFDVPEFTPLTFLQTLFLFVDVRCIPPLTYNPLYLLGEGAAWWMRGRPEGVLRNVCADLFMHDWVPLRQLKFVCKLLGLRTQQNRLLNLDEMVASGYWEVSKVARNSSPGFHVRLRLM
jgi:hypothetical protein